MKWIALAIAAWGCLMFFCFSLASAAKEQCSEKDKEFSQYFEEVCRREEQ